jgi:hypothetical protein
MGAIRADYQDKEAGDIAASFASEVRPQFSTLPYLINFTA